MRKIFKPLVMRFTLILMIAFLFAGKSFSQIDITIGTGTIGNTTTTYPCPLQDFYEGHRAQYLYLASELTAAGMGPGNIGSIKYNVTSLGTAGLIEQFSMKIGTTTAGSLGTATWETIATTVIPPTNYQPVAGINTFTFTAPFFWNGTDNLVVEVCNGEPGNATGTWFTNNPVIPWTTGLAFNGSHSYRADNLGNFCGTATTTNTGTQTTRPNITFSWTPATNCTGIPAGGTSVANPSSVCLGQSFLLTVTGATVASGLTYQWESSPDNISYSPVSGATNSSLTTTQAASTWYRRVTTCTNAGGGSANSTPVQVTSPSLVQGTFTINSALPTGGTNFISYNAAYDYIKCGIAGPVIFNVAPGSGPYTEQLNMIAVPGASATNTVTFNGNGTTLRFLSTNTNERAVIKLNNADHITFDSLNITALGTLTTEYGFGVQLIDNADSNVIKNCQININTTSTSTNYAGIVMSASATSATTTGNTICDNNLFENNTITGGYYGITMVGSTTVSVQRNKVLRNKFKDQYLYTMYLLGNFDALIEANDITRAVTAISATSCYGIYVTSLNTKVIISKNRIHDIFNAQLTTTNDFYGIYHTGVDALATLENVVVNNAVYDIKGNGSIYGIYNTSSDNIWYYHNTIALDDAASTSTETTRGFFQTTLAGGIEFRNNMVTIKRGGTGAKHAIYMATATTIYISNNNDFYLSAGGTTNYVGFNGTNQATLANWQLATGKDANSISTDPLYANILTGLFQPTNASVNDLGANLSANYTVATDIINTSRTIATPDMGAWEFSPGACFAPPEPGTSTTTLVGPVCPNTFGTFNLIGNSIGLGQTYEWEFSTTIAGTYSSIGAANTNPSFNYSVQVTGYFRCKVTCSGISTFSVPVLVNVNSLLPGGTYTINSTLPTGGINFQSFNAAYQAMKCGIAGPIILNVVTATGPYNEQLLLDSIQGTSAINTITWNGNGNAISYISTNTAERGVIRLNGVKHMIFDSLIVNTLGTTTTQYGHGFHLQNNSDSNIIRKCTINLDFANTSANYAGIVLSGGTTATTTGNNRSDNNLIENNTIKGGYYGITIVGAAADKTFNNTVRGNKIFDSYLYGIYTSVADNLLIEKNDISRPARTTLPTSYGIYSTGLSDNQRISKNRIHDPCAAALSGAVTYYGIYHTGVDAATAATVSNNLLYNFNGAGTFYGLYNTSSNNINYYHNTIDFSDASNTSATNCYGFYQTTLATDLEIKNNIFTLTRAGTGQRFGLYFATATTLFTSDNNDIFVPGTNGFTGFNGANRITLADWQTAIGGDAASLAANPIYQSPATGNFQPISPVVDNKGVNAGITTDIRDLARSLTTPDIGAYEFVVPPCTTPPPAGISVANPNTGICMGTPVQLSLTGIIYSSGQTYQWQTATAAAGPYTNLGGVMIFPDTTIISSGTLYYRCVVTCSGNSTNSTPALVNLNPAFLAGTYTINNTLPTGGVNFNSFNAAVAALYCGITGHVIFNVAAGTYTEQVRIGNIPGTGPTATVTFQSATGVASSAILTYSSTLAAANYTLKLDSARYFTFNALTINGTNTTNGRVVELANTTSNSTVKNCIINAPVTTAASTNLVGVFSNSLRGADNLVKGNTISNGSAGIYVAGLSAAAPAIRFTADSNTVNGFYQYGIYLGNSQYSGALRNAVNNSGTQAASAYGIYLTACDSAYFVKNNAVNITNTTATEYGIYLTNCDASGINRGDIANNKISAPAGNTGTLYGLYQTTAVGNNTLNNVIHIQTSGATSYGMYATGGGNINFYNNSVQNNSTSATNNFGAYFSNTAATNGIYNIRNNIFSHSNNGTAVHVNNAFFIYSDYNMFYTAGPTLIRYNTTNLPSLKRWQDTTFWDISSIHYKPAFISNTNLQPDLTNPEVWGVHGRGVQIAGNDKDINGANRPTTLTTGVPDLGAYEFYPTALPVALLATPAAPIANSTQIFSLGTDTVARVKWGAAVPASVTGKRYSGDIPPGLAPGQQHMYFYSDFDIPAGAVNFEMKQYYVDSWQGFIPNEQQIKLGRTNAAAAWIVNPASVIDEFNNEITEPGLSFMDKFTGLTDGLIAPPPPPPVVTIDTSNRGKRFWVDYGHHQFFPGTNAQDMVLYLSATDSANVTVRVNGTSYNRVYRIPANTAISTELIPKMGLYDARILAEGKFNRGISITSDVPIEAYAHIYGSASSGATMLLPIGTYGYEYYALGFRQNYAADTYSWFSVIADRDSTVIELTPSNPTLGGRPANVPFTVTLNRGEVYQVLGRINTGSNGFDMTGSKAKSMPNSQGKCLPFAFFSGSSRTAIYCAGQNTSGNGDNIIQQNFPSQAWGKRYLTAPTSNTSSASSFITNIYRVMVKDPTTVVTRNGVVLAGLVNNLYYEFDSNTADYIVSDKPVMVAQYMPSSGSNCPNSAGNGDPEMIYISPLEQGIKNVRFYRNVRQAITLNTITLIVPTAGVASLLIDGSNTFDHTYAHPNLLGYSVVIKRWTAAAAQSRVICDSAFTAVTYGQGSVESYGYNAGTLVKNLNAISSISNVLGSGASPYTCRGTPFRFNMQLSVKPSQITWYFSQIANLVPNTDVIQNNPVPTDSTIINGVKFYNYTVAQDYVYNGVGTFIVPVNIVHPSIESCNNSLDLTISVTVLPKPVTDFTYNFSGCIGDVVQFNGTSITNNGVPVNQWNWNFGDATNGVGQNPTKLYSTAGTYNVQLRAIGSDGCLGDTTKPIVINPRPTVAVSPDSISTCIGSNATFTIQNPVTGTTYNWYNAATGGTLLGTGTSFTLNNVQANTVVYAEALRNGCISVTRARAIVTVLPLLTPPIAVVDSVGVNFITFRWNAVPNAVSYDVSINNGVTWQVPSTGPTGLRHRVTGLSPLQSVTLIVRANGGCQSTISQPVTGKTWTDQIYFPNSFTPNGDGRNDIWLVYGYIIKDLRIMIFNQWGEKIFESRNQSKGWDGLYKGKKQPVGVYMYVGELILTDGSKKTYKGSINLIQ